MRRAGAAGMAVAAGLALVTVDVGAAPDADERERYEGRVEVVRGPADAARAAADGDPTTVRGVVFDDEDRDSRADPREEGVAGVLVSNGREVVATDDGGAYELPAYDGMTVFITKPEGFDVPVDEHNFPQFSYHHLPAGSPDLRFGGLPPTGPLPQAINFPVTPGEPADSVHCAVIGDTQTYSGRELGYLRDGVVADLAARDDLDGCGAVIAGDLVGDDLGLYPRFKEVMSLAGVPIWGVPGNHDLDFDATDDAHSFDTYKREIGPAYYSFDVGDAHFVGLDNVRYPCTPEVDNADGKHAFCDDPANHPRYNGVLGEEQLAWLANDLAHVPEDKLIVIATHIPLVSFIDMASTQHQTDDVEALYALLEGRPALSVSGHAQLVENMEAGDSFLPWQEAVGVTTIPFPHITVGAASGSWWTGDLDTNGIPESLQRGGGPPGYIDLEIADGAFVDTYRATLRDDDEQMWVSLSSPTYRAWFDQLAAWKAANPAGSPDRPPVNINDLGDPSLLSRADLTTEGGSALMANVWNGSTDTTVSVQIDGGAPVPATRTQEARGEDMRAGAEFADPFSTMRQLQVSRHALESTSGDERAQGWEAYRGTTFGPGPTQPISQHLWADQSSHLWRLPVPADIAPGPHSATVQVTDQHGRTYERSLHFEVAEEKPPMPFRTELFEPPAAG